MKRELRFFDNQTLCGDIKADTALFKEIFIRDAAFRMRPLFTQSSTECLLMFVDGMINTETLNQAVIRPLVTNLCSDIDQIKTKVLYANELSSSSNVRKLISALLYGDSILLIQGSPEALIINTKGWRTRGINEPTDERVLKGPREGFDESIMLNLAMLRRKLPTPDLCVEYITIGRKTDTKVFVCYLESLVLPKTVRRLKRKLNAIDIDGILDSNYISEMINNGKFSLFKTVGSTERPDVVAAKLLEGRVALIIDGTPVVLTLPYLFAENFQSDDDYYLNYLVAGLGRALRYICFYLGICMPALYVALTIFHPDLIPAHFLISVAKSREAVPFSSFGESCVLIIIFEILKETGIRMQQSVGHALSIVGGLVIGQAAVEAGIVSAPMLIVTAFSGIASLMVPRLKAAVFYSKLLTLALSAAFGLFGFFVGITLIHLHLYSLRSFGADYIGSGLNFSLDSLKDSIIRVPWSKMITRPSALTKNIIRMKPPR